MKPKQIAAYSLMAFMPGLGFMLGLLLLNDMLTAFALMFGIGVLGIIIAHYHLLPTPFSTLDYGSHYPVLDFSSMGVINIYKGVMKSAQRIQFKTPDGLKELFMNRDAITYVNPPIETKIEEGKDGLNINLPKNEYADSKFGMGGRACLIYNRPMNTFLTKGWLDAKETDIFVNHNLLSIAHNIDKLGEQMQPFSSYIIEMLKKQEKWWQKDYVRWIVLIIGILVVIMVAINIFGNTSTIEAASNLIGAPTQLITPR